MENKWLCDSCLKRDVCLIQITHNADTPIVDCKLYLNAGCEDCEVKDGNDD